MALVPEAILEKLEPMALSRVVVSTYGVFPTGENELSYTHHTLIYQLSRAKVQSPNQAATVLIQ